MKKYIGHHCSLLASQEPRETFLSSSELWEESLWCFLQPARSGSGPLGVSGWLLLRMRKPGKVVTQSPPSLQLVPLNMR